MKYNQAFIRGITKDGEFGNIDLMKLDNESFRAFVLDLLCRAGLIVHIKSEVVEGNEISMKEQS